MSHTFTECSRCRRPVDQESDETHQQVTCPDCLTGRGQGTTADNMVTVEQVATLAEQISAGSPEAYERARRELGALPTLDQLGPVTAAMLIIEAENQRAVPN
jgi:hypothetical protein